MSLPPLCPNMGVGGEAESFLTPRERKRTLTDYGPALGTRVPLGGGGREASVLRTRSADDFVNPRAKAKVGLCFSLGALGAVSGPSRWRVLGENSRSPDESNTP